MLITLRDYQSSVIDDTRAKMRQTKRVLVQLPTGGGKTAIAAYMAGQSVERGANVWFICHRAELVMQTSLTFRKYGLQHAFIAAGYPMNLRAPIQICSIDTLKGRFATLRPPKIAIIDEAHHSSAAGWAKVIEWLTAGGSYVIGLSATPQRLDGRGLNEHFDDIVIGPSTAWLMQQGHLSQYRVFAPSMPDMTGVRRQMGDFARGEAAEKMDKPTLTGDIIKHWKKYANGMRTVAFAVTVAHSQHLAEQFRANGVSAAHLDGSTPKSERAQIIRDYAAGRLDVLTNVDLFGEGFDLSAIAQTDVTIDCVIQARPTQSLSLHLQQVGRALRPAPGKIAIILDHAGNLMRHGFPDDDREWTLDGREKGKKAANDNAPPPPVICSGCFNAIKRPLPLACPHCGKPLIVKAKEIKVVEGELHEITEADKVRVRSQMKREQAEADTLQELIALGQRRKYKSPVGWAQKVYAGRRKSA